MDLIQSLVNPLALWYQSLGIHTKTAQTIDLRRTNHSQVHASRLLTMSGATTGKAIKTNIKPLTGLFYV